MAQGKHQADSEHKRKGGKQDYIVVCRVFTWQEDGSLAFAGVVQQEYGVL